ncbi:MAG: ribose-phosphate diphosphokinase [Candidatus Altiarchaeales archaeon]|nr:ribose-phosphate diphosphokinase [Candidatus Altiarchaeota archaeon]MCG2782237.1 ribose-phosphate diphosphokinase [Candidatus Altiarchaeales archaeon]MBU4267081.1 ribose-phosphate diphosphokinase [Candidatus Altiarchaeota archaeon]MBU4342364.1 ribose-phosphate diphosphokinase [Candidatus Altiarchaeota archaeon]MBU4406878.1 ribose-phosphate diphosphokinase [Candidatus Altiarchaeota archaeon]
MLILGCSNSSELAGRISQELGGEVAEVEIKRFPDGEIYVRVVSDVKGKECAVVQSTPDNGSLVELILTLDLLRDLGASRIHAVVPYLGYCRQEKRFQDGEALSAKTVLKIIDSLSDSILTVNCHFLDAGGEFDFNGIKLKNIDAFPEIANYFKGKVESPFLIAPDEGSLELVKNSAGIVGCEFDSLEKERISGEEVKTEAKEMGVEGKDVIILDDAISTGNTIINAAKLVREQGAKSVSAGCVHGIFSNGLEKLKAAADEVVCTDTVQGDASRVSVAKLIAKELG